MTHRELCIKAARHLKYKGIQPFHRCQYVVCELERIGESPDAFGFGGSTTQLIEVKVSRSDFLSDKAKFWRQHPEHGLGRFRSYLCPEGIIKVSDLPAYWGLLYVSESGMVQEIMQPTYQKSSDMAELQLITSILRRENIKPQIFSYKRYKNDINK